MTAGASRAGPTLFVPATRQPRRRTVYDTQQDPELYVDGAGTGDCLALDRPLPLIDISDRRRWNAGWTSAASMAFHFDLGTALRRRDTRLWIPDRPFFPALAAEPILVRTRLSARLPSNTRPGGSRSASSAPRWADRTTAFANTRAPASSEETPGCAAEFAARMAGCRADVLRGSRSRAHREACRFRRRPRSLHAWRRLSSFNHQHNQANGENNRDGTDNNNSSNLASRGQAAIQR